MNLIKRGFVTAIAIIKILVLFQIVVKQKVLFTKSILTVKLLDIDKNVTLAHVKQHWNTNDCNGTPKFTWKIIRICHSHNPIGKRWLLRLNEKLQHTMKTTF